jgi:hypothetical protein
MHSSHAHRLHDEEHPPNVVKLLIAVLELPTTTVKLSIDVVINILVGVKFHYLMSCSLVSDES